MSRNAEKRGFLFPSVWGLSSSVAVKVQLTPNLSSKLVSRDRANGDLAREYWWRNAGNHNWRGQEILVLTFARVQIFSGDFLYLHALLSLSRSRKKYVFYRRKFRVQLRFGRLRDFLYSWFQHGGGRWLRWLCGWQCKQRELQPRSQGPLSSYLEKVPWLRLVTCLLDFSRFQRCDSREGLES